jgi:hypothetical protein
MLLREGNWAMNGTSLCFHYQVISHRAHAVCELNTLARTQYCTTKDLHQSSKSLSMNMMAQTDNAQILALLSIYDAGSPDIVVCFPVLWKSRASFSMTPKRLVANRNAFCRMRCWALALLDSLRQKGTTDRNTFASIRKNHLPGK